MIHRISAEEISAVWEEYRRNYPPFIPISLRSYTSALGEKVINVIETQNGQDFDDYAVGDDNKIEKYLSDVRKGSKVLLLGVGTGRETRVALDIGLDAVGITLGSRNIEFGKRYLGLTSANHIECVAELLPYPREHFDIVAGFQFFEHAMMPMILLLEQGRVLKMGGKIILEWPPALTHTGDANPHHQVCYTPGQARALLMKAGFGNIKLYKSDKTPIPDEDIWRGDLPYNMVVEGIKEPAKAKHVYIAWR